LDLRNLSDGDANVNVFFCRFAATRLPQQRYLSLVSFCTMSGSGDCPQFVSMLNSAAQSLLTAKTINNEGLHFRLAFSKPCSSQLLFALTCVSSDLTKSLTILKDAHVLFSASNDRIASFSAQEWENWFKVLTKVPAIFCQLCSLFILFFADFRSCKHFSTS